jgi:hypothetical protein
VPWRRREESVEHNSLKQLKKGFHEAGVQLVFQGGIYVWAFTCGEIGHICLMQNHRLASKSENVRKMMQKYTAVSS